MPPDSPFDLRPVGLESLTELTSPVGTEETYARNATGDPRRVSLDTIARFVSEHDDLTSRYPSVITHQLDASTARVGTAPTFWIGQVDPTNATDGDALYRIDQTAYYQRQGGVWVEVGRARFAPRDAPNGVAGLATATTTNVDTIMRSCWYKGVLYLAGAWSQGGSNLGGWVMSVDLTSMVLSTVYNTGEQSVRSMAVYRDKLYVGTGISGKVFSFDGTTWALAFTGTGGSGIIAMAVYNGKLYAGETATGKLYSYDGTTWATAVTLPAASVHIESLCVFNGLLWIGDGKSAAAWSVYAYDGTNCAEVFVGSTVNKSELLALATWRGKLYGAEFDPTGAAKIYEYDPTLATPAFTAITVPNTPTALYSLCQYRDALYIGSHPNGYLFRYDGAEVKNVGTATLMQSIRDLVVVDDRLIVTARAAGTPSTGGAVFVYGDNARRTPNRNEVPPVVQVPRAERLGPVVVGTFDPTLPTSALSIAVANRRYYGKVRIQKATYVTGLRISIGTSSGNVSVAIHNAANVRVATSGSVACPASGTRTIALTTPVWLLPGDYWFSISADDTTATFNALNPTVIISEISEFEESAFTAPATKAGTAGVSPRQYPVWI